MDLQLITEIKQWRLQHTPMKHHKDLPEVCTECNDDNGQGRLALYPCVTLRAFDALIRVADLARFMASPINIGLDVDQAAKEIELAIKYETNYNAAPIFGGVNNDV
jgi:hypothetical protein